MKEAYEQIKSFETTDEIEMVDKRALLKYIEIFAEKLLYRHLSIAHLTASAIVLDPQMKYVLMAHHNIYNSWGWLGGHVDGNSDFESVARREVFEETGVENLKLLIKNIASLEILPVPGHYKNGEYISAHLHLNVTYLYTTKMDTRLVVKEDENSKVDWLLIDELDDHCSEKEMLPIYKKIIGRAHQINNDYL